MMYTNLGAPLYPLMAVGSPHTSANFFPISIGGRYETAGAGRLSYILSYVGAFVGIAA